MMEMKKFNKLNIPTILAYIIIAVQILFFIINLPSFLNNGLAIIKWILCILICPIFLILQIKNKQKTLSDYLFIVLNIIIIFLSYCLFVLSFIIFPNNNQFNGEEKCRRQIELEKDELNNISEYINNHVKENGELPQNIDKIVNNSKIFDKYEYIITRQDSQCKDKPYTCYDLFLYPKRGPIEYYYQSYKNDEYKSDEFLDDIYNYKVNENWMASKNQLFTRHNIFDNLYF